MTIDSCSPGFMTYKVTARNIALDIFKHTCLNSFSSSTVHLLTIHFLPLHQATAKGKHVKVAAVDAVEKMKVICYSCTMH